jgi:WD40 repeat protein
VATGGGGQGECENFMMIKGHKLAVTDVHWTTDGQTLITSGADKTLRAFDALTSKQIKKMAGHSSIVNACCPARRGPQLIVSGSDDGTAKVRQWVREAVQAASEALGFEPSASRATDSHRPVANCVVSDGCDPPPRHRAPSGW